MGALKTIPLLLSEWTNLDYCAHKPEIYITREFYMQRHAPVCQKKEESPGFLPRLAPPLAPA